MRPCCAGCRVLFVSWPRRRSSSRKRPDLEEGHYVDVTVPDHVHVLTEFENGERGLYHFSGVSLFGPSKQIHMYGSRGTIKVEFTPEERVLVGRRGDQQLKTATPSEEQLGRWRVEEEFNAAIRGGRLSRTDGLRHRSRIHAVHRSGRSKRRVRLGSVAAAVSRWRNGRLIGGGGGLWNGRGHCLRTCVSRNAFSTTIPDMGAFTRPLSHQPDPCNCHHRDNCFRLAGSHVGLRIHPVPVGTLRRVIIVREIFSSALSGLSFGMRVSRTRSVVAPCTFNNPLSQE